MASITAKELAKALGMDAKALRSRIRRMHEANGGIVGVDTPGSGGRYVFDDADVEAWRIALTSNRASGKTMLMTPSALVQAVDDESATIVS